MGFIAGIFTTNNDLDIEKLSRFEEAVDSLEIKNHRRLSGKNHVLIQLDNNDLWEGPKYLSEKDYNAICTGTQWKNNPSESPTTAYLVSKFLDMSVNFDHCFDYFSIAVVDKEANACIIAADPLGLSCVYYFVDKDHLVFSTNQVFIRDYLKQDFKISWDSVFEFLIIRHLLGNKSLIEGVNRIPSGAFIKFDKKIHIINYFSYDKLKINTEINIVDIQEKIISHINDKIIGYRSLTNKPFLGTLSGGWDSRLVCALLSNYNLLEETYTTEQGVKLYGKHVLESKIALEVTNLLKSKNSFFPILQHHGSDVYYTLAKVTDYSSTLNVWALNIIDHIPKNKFIIAGGFLGDHIIRGTHLPEELVECVISNDKEKAAEIILSKFLTGLDHANRPYNQPLIEPSITEWGEILSQKFIEHQTKALRLTVERELGGTSSDNFYTEFQIKNRQRSLGTNLSRIFSTKGPIITVLFDPVLFELTHSVPIDIKQNSLFYKGILENINKEIYLIPSTNNLNEEKHKEYLKQELIYSYSNIILNQIPPKIKNTILRIYRRLFNKKSSSRLIAEEIITNGLPITSQIMNHQIQEAILKKERSVIENYSYFFKQLLVLEKFLKNDQKHNQRL